MVYCYSTFMMDHNQDKEFEVEKLAIKILQISDTHLFADTSKDLLGIVTDDSLDQVIRTVQEDKRQPDLLLLTGDLAQDGSEVAYKRLSEKVKFLNCPTYWIPGNHDKPETMFNTFSTTHISNDKCINCDPWQIVLLDSHKEKCVEGFLNKKELKHLKNCLRQNAKFVLLVIHHHVIPIQSKWLDTIGLENAAEFLKAIKGIDNINGVMCGHIHQVFEEEKEDIFYFSVPSTCIQFKPKSVDFELDIIAPGYRWVELNPDGTITTEVKRVKNFVGKVDKKAWGY